MSAKREATVKKNGVWGAEFIQVTVRMPPSMYERLKEASATSGRSQHAEIIHRLGVALGEDLATDHGADESTITHMAADIRRLRELAEHFITTRGAS